MAEQNENFVSGPKPDNFPKNKIITKKEQRHIDYVGSYQNPLEKTIEFERIMKAEILSQSALAKKLGISRVRINQYLSLLKFPKDRQHEILQYGKERIITERSLRNSPKTKLNKNSLEIFFNIG